MAFFTTFGQETNELAKSIYKSTRSLVSALVESGKISAQNADKEFARRVSEELINNKINIPKWISKLLS